MLKRKVGSLKFDDLSSVLPIIGRNLVSLVYKPLDPSLITIERIIKKLAKLIINDKFIMLGTDWDPYRARGDVAI
jgi:hypothetical protein